MTTQSSFLPIPLAPATTPVPDTAVLHGMFLSYIPAPSGDFTMRLEIVSIPHSLAALETLVGGPVGALQGTFSGTVALCRTPEASETSIANTCPWPQSLGRVTSLFPSNPPLDQLGSKFLFLDHNLGVGVHRSFALDNVQSLTTARFEPLFDFLAPAPDVQFRSAALLRLHLSQSLGAAWCVK
jgi:hypothetical protein